MKNFPFLSAVASAVVLAGTAQAATVVTNNTGLSSSSIIFLDYESQAGTTSVPGIGTMASTRSGAGNDGDGNAFGDVAGYASGGSLTYTFSELVAGETYNLYANWYGNGTDNCAVGMTANASSLGTFSQITTSVIGANGFTAYQETNDPAGEAKAFPLLGTAVADANGDIVIVAGLGNRQFFRNDGFAVAPVPEPSAALLGAGSLLALLRRRKR